MKIKIRLGPKGQVVIPKVIRDDTVGLRENADAILETKKRALEIRPLDSDLVEKAKLRAIKHGGDLKRLWWVYGDRLYEFQISRWKPHCLSQKKSGPCME